jgi:hypothetical protein
LRLKTLSIRIEQLFDTQLKFSRRVALLAGDDIVMREVTLKK